MGARLIRVVKSTRGWAWFRRFWGEWKQVRAKPALGRVSRLMWRDPLDHPRTIRLLTGREIAETRDEPVLLPNQDRVIGARPQHWDEAKEFQPEFVWRIEQAGKVRSIRITPSGTVLVNNRYLLQTDQGSWAGLVERPLRRRVTVDLAIAPWSHSWSAPYADYLLFVVSKLCRIKAALDESSWANSTLCYPLRRTSWEQQYLSCLGFSEDRLLDTRRKIQVSARTVVIANNQGCLWLPSPSAILALRRAFLTEPQHETGRKGRRLYISRSRYGRSVRNEEDVRRAVTSFGVEVLEDVPPSVSKQIQLFLDASLVVAPHGSALANLVWCAPGTRIIELLSRSYAQIHFAYLSHILGLDYRCLIDDSGGPYHWTNMFDADVSVDVDSLKQTLEATLAPT
jgi:Glycosyltransferase 61